MQEITTAEVITMKMKVIFQAERMEAAEDTKAEEVVVIMAIIVSFISFLIISMKLADSSEEDKLKDFQ